MQVGEGKSVTVAAIVMATGRELSWPVEYLDWEGVSAQRLRFGRGVGEGDKHRGRHRGRRKQAQPIKRGNC